MWMPATILLLAASAASTPTPVPTVPGQELESESHVDPPRQRLPATQGQDVLLHAGRTEATQAQMKEHNTAHSLQRRESAVTPEEYEEFFRLVDSLLWDSEEESGRQYKRGWLAMRRPALLSRRNGSPAPFYRTVVDQCYDLMCKLGINGFINRIGRLLS